MPSAGHRISGRRKAAPGARGVEVIGPASTLARKVAEVLEQHARTESSRTGTGRGRQSAVGGAARFAARKGRRNASESPLAFSPDAASQRAYLVNALAPDGSTSPSEVRRQIRCVREIEPSAPVFVLLDEGNARAVRAAVQAGATDFLGAAAAANPAALEWRIFGLLQRSRNNRQGSAATDAATLTRRRTPALHLEVGAPVEPTESEIATALARVEAGLKHVPTAAQALRRAAKDVNVVAPELRDEASGRFDAKRIAEHLGVSVNRLAQATGVSQQALSKRPTSPGAQKGLASIARAITVLGELLEADEARMWLHTPHPRLGDASPVEVLLRGEGDTVARMLESAVEGIAD
jgi:hypothetical protein